VSVDSAGGVGLQIVSRVVGTSTSVVGKVETLVGGEGTATYIWVVSPSGIVLAMEAMARNSAGSRVNVDVETYVMVFLTMPAPTRLTVLTVTVVTAVVTVTAFAAGGLSVDVVVEASVDFVRVEVEVTANVTTGTIVGL